MAKTLSILAIVALLLNAGCASLPVSKLERAQGSESVLHFEQIPAAETVSRVERKPEADVVSHFEFHFDAQGETENQEGPAQESEAEKPPSPFMSGMAMAGGFVLGFILFMIVLTIIF